jgi:hypothetical protein
MFSLTRQSYDLAPGPHGRPAPDSMSSATRLLGSLRISSPFLGNAKILPEILSPTALPKPVPAVTPAILSSDSSIRSQASAASVVARVPSEDTVER